MFTENQIVPSIHFYQLTGLTPTSFINKDSRFTVYAFPVFCHLEKISLVPVREMGPHKIPIPFLVPNRSTIVPTGFGKKRSQWLPRSFGTYSRSHEIPFVRSPEKKVKPSVVITQCTGPNPTGITVHNVPVQCVSDLCQVFNSIPTDFPVHQVLGMQDRHSRRELESRRYGIIIVPHPDTVYIAVIRRDNRIHVHSSGLFSPNSPIPPNFLLLRFQPCRQAKTKNHRIQISFHNFHF